MPGRCHRGGYENPAAGHRAIRLGLTQMIGSTYLWISLLPILTPRHSYPDQIFRVSANKSALDVLPGGPGGAYGARAPVEL